MEYIQLKKGNGQKRFGIRTPDGEDTGEYIEIDIEDIELPLKASECQTKHVENYNKLKEKLEKSKEKSNDEKGDILTEQQKEMIEAFNEFYKAEEEALDLFLGDGATRKLLGGRKPYLTMYDDINEYLEQIIPTLEISTESLKKSIEEKYKEEKEDNIL